MTYEGVHHVEHSKKSSTCQRQRYSSVIVNAGKPIYEVFERWIKRYDRRRLEQSGQLIKIMEENNERPMAKGLKGRRILEDKS